MVAKATMNFVGIVHPHALGEMDSAAEVRKKTLPEGKGYPCQDMGVAFLS